MTPRRRSDDPDDLDVLSQRFIPAAKLVRFAWVIGAGLIALVGGAYLLDHRLATAAASEVVEARMAPVEKRLDDHLSAMASKREVMDITVKQLTDVMAKQNKKLDALCRASARPQVCLGED